MMRWFFGVFKILLFICIVGFAVNAVFVYKFDIKPYQIIVDKVKGVKAVQPEKNNSDNLIDPKREENIDNESKKSENEVENSQSTGDTKSKVNPENPDNPDEYFLTFKEINSVENMNLQDKLTGLSIISKIKNSDLQKIYKLADGGITLEELKELKKILDRNLSKSEIEKLDDLLMKNRKLFAQGQLTK